MPIQNITRVNTVDEWRIQTNQSANSINNIETGNFNKTQGVLTVSNTGSISITAEGTPLSVSNTALFSSNITVGRNISLGAEGSATGNLSVGANVFIYGRGNALFVANNATVNNNLQVTQTITTNNITTNTNVTVSGTTQSGNLIVDRIAVIVGNTTAGNLTTANATSTGSLRVNDTTETTSNISGAAFVAGGVGISKSAFISGDVTIKGDSQSTVNNRVSLLIGDLVANSAGNLYIYAANTANGGSNGSLTLQGNGLITGNLTVGSGLESTSKTSVGALKINGGVAVSANVHGNALYDNGNRVARTASASAPISTTLDVATGALSISHDVSGVTAATHGTSIQIPVFEINSTGHITSVTNTTVRSATTGQTGVTQLEDSISSISTTTAAVPNSVRTAVLNGQANVGAARIADTAASQANVGLGLITVTAAYQANVGAGRIADKSSWEANSGAGNIIVTNAYQANVGAARIADTAASQANVGLGLITVTNAYQANVGAGRIADKASWEANSGVGNIIVTNNFQANTGAARLELLANIGLARITDTAAAQANSGAGNIIVTNAYQANVGAARIADVASARANVGAARIADTAAAQANSGAGDILVTNAYQANVGAARITDIAASQANVGFANNLIYSSFVRLNPASTPQTIAGSVVFSGPTTLQSASVVGGLTVGGDFTVTGQQLVDTNRIKLMASTRQTIGSGFDYVTINRTNTAASLVTLNGTTDVVTLNGHGLSTGQSIRLSSISTGVTVLANNTTYRVTVVDPNTFRLSTVAGYPSILDFGGAGNAAVQDLTNVDADIRWDEANEKWQVRDVDNLDDSTAYSNLLTANLISDSTTVNTTTTLASSRALRVGVNEALANVGLARISDTAASQANVGSGLITLNTNLTAAYQANAGAGDITVTNAVTSAYQANVGAARITDRAAWEANTGALNIAKFDKSGGTISGSVSINGDLTVTGTTTTVNTVELNIRDNDIVLNSNWPLNTMPTSNAGITIYRGNIANSPNVFIRYDETNDYWVLRDNTGQYIIATHANVGAGDIAVTNASQANVGAGLISLNNSLTSAYQANVGAARIADTAAAQANTGAGLITVTNAYQANVGAARIADTAAAQANTGAGLISLNSSLTSAYQANVGAARIADTAAAQANTGAGLISLNTSITNAYQANVGAGRIADKATWEANSGAGLIALNTNLTAAYQANAGAGLIALNTNLTAAYQANAGAGDIAVTNASRANVGAGLITKVSTSGDTLTGSLNLGDVTVSEVRTTYRNNNKVRLIVKPSFDMDGGGSIGANDALVLNQMLIGAESLESKSNTPYIIQHANNLSTGILTIPGNLLELAVGVANSTGGVIITGGTANTGTATSTSNVWNYIRVGGGLRPSNYNPSSGDRHLTSQVALYSNNDVAIRTGSGFGLFINDNLVWHAGNDGTGSGLDADTLDGIDSTGFVRTSSSQSMSGSLAITDSTASTSTSTGALRVTGGISTQANLWSANVVSTGPVYGTTGVFDGGVRVARSTTGNSPIATNLAANGVLTVSHVNSTVSSGNYGGPSTVPVITVDQTGHITYAANIAIAISASAITAGTLDSGRLGTTGTPQFGSVGVGTAASGTTGEIRATGDITAGYSDDKLKTKVGEISNALDKVLQLTGFYYRPNDLAQSLGYNDKVQVGLSAQEVQKVLPEVVVPAPIDSTFLTVQYEKVVPLLVEAIKELKTELDQIKSRLKD